MRRLLRKTTSRPPRDVATGRRRATRGLAGTTTPSDIADEVDRQFVPILPSTRRALGLAVIWRERHARRFHRPSRRGPQSGTAGTDARAPAPPVGPAKLRAGRTAAVVVARCHPGRDAAKRPRTGRTRSGDGRSAIDARSARPIVASVGLIAIVCTRFNQFLAAGWNDSVSVGMRPLPTQRRDLR